MKVTEVSEMVGQLREKFCRLQVRSHVSARVGKVRKTAG